MEPETAPDFLPISMLNQVEYCPRRFWYMFVQGEMKVNALVLDGQLKHQRVHERSATHRGSLLETRRVYVFSRRLRVAGFVDLLEEEGGLLRPVEYKRGRAGRWENDRVQLCAQAICLEERMGLSIPVGYLYYMASRRRVEVPLDDALRRRTEEAARKAFRILESGRIPPPLERWELCRNCSLEPVCMPREVLALRGKARAA